nr:protein 108-like [Ipomoea batatas]
MAGMKVTSILSLVAVVLLVATALQSREAEAQTAADTCATQLGNINVCAPFVMPGMAASNPSADCCTALQSVDRDCICNTLRVSARLPSQCNIPPLSCPSQ